MNRPKIKIKNKKTYNHPFLGGIMMYQKYQTKLKTRPLKKKKIKIKKNIYIYIYIY